MRRKNDSLGPSASLTPATIGLREVFAGAPDVVFCCDGHGRWVWVSPSIEQLIGHRPADLIGQPAMTLIAPVERRAGTRRLLRLLGPKLDAGLEYECSAMSASGHVVRVAFKVNRIEQDGEFAFVGIARRGSPSRTGFRVLKPGESEALGTQGGTPYHAPRHRNEPIRVEDAAWNATGFNELPEKMTPWNEAVAGAGDDLELPSAPAEANGEPVAELAAARALLEDARIEAALSRAQANEARDQVERAERTAREAGERATAAAREADAAVQAANIRASRAEAERDEVKRSQSTVNEQVASANQALAAARDDAAAARRVADTARAECERLASRIAELEGAPTGASPDETFALRAELEAARRAADASARELEAARRALDERSQDDGTMRTELEEARHALRDRSDHFASVSHDIRTPMNGIIGMAQLLLESDPDAEHREMLEVIRSSGHSLLAIINDALEFARIDAGRIEVEAIDFDLRVTVEQIAALLAPMAAEKKLPLEVQVGPDVPSKVKGDPGRVRQVLLNLATNAIKQVDRGGIRVRVERVDEQDDTVSLRFCVQTVGAGFRPDQVQGVLQSYAQADPAIARRFGAIGLGLYVSRRLVTLMHGAVGVDGDGGALWFELALAKQAAASDTAIDHPVVDLGGVRVLLVDPASTLRQSMAEMLEAWGARVDQSGNHDDAMNKLRAAAEAGEPVQVALIDIQLGWVAGEALGVDIRRDAQLADTRTMLLTSVGRKGDAQLAMRAGFSAYLIKPVPWSELYDALVEVLRRAPVALESTESGLVTRHSLAEARRGRFRVLLVEDDPVNRLVTEWALRRHGYWFEAVECAGDALEASAKNRYDLVLMDLQMPDMDGYRATSALRARERGGSRTPIVAMTGNALPGERERCLAAGMDDYLSKPIDLGLLIETVERWTHGRHDESAGVRAATAGGASTAATSEPSAAVVAARAEPRLTESARGPASSGPAPRISIVGRADYERIRIEDVPEDADPAASEWEDPVEGEPIDFDRLNDTSMGIPGLREALLNTFLGDVGERVERLADAIEAKDARRVEFEAHGLKGMAATIGARTCVGAFAELERCGRENDLRVTPRPLERARTEVARVRAYIEAMNARGGEAAAA